MVSDVTFTNVIQEAKETENQRIQIVQDFDDFLTLLTTQLQNQDPLSPMDSTEFTNQLVQFSQVEQQINANEKLDNLVQLQLANSFTASLGYVGLDVSYLSSEMNFDGTSPVQITYALDRQPFTSKINVFSEQGDLVYSTDGSKNVGINEFTWNGELTGGGTAEPGTYNVRIDALDAEGKVIDSSVVVTGRVRGVETQDGTLFLLVGERAVPIANVLNAQEPPQITDNGDNEENSADGGESA